MPEAYAFNYLRADKEEVKIGPFLTPGTAKAARQSMEDTGAICDQVHPIEISQDDYRVLEAKAKGYVANQLVTFRSYLNGELTVLKRVDSYYIIGMYINELEKRVKRFVRQNAGSRQIKGLDKETTEEFTQGRVEYLRGVSEYLDFSSKLYSPLDGSVPEEIKKTLEKLANETLKKI